MLSIASRFNAETPTAVEFHGAPMRNGKESWNGVSPDARVQATVDALGLLADPRLKMKVIASVIEKARMAVADVVPRSFENIAHRFDQFLADRWHRLHDPQRGLVICDKSGQEQKLQSLSACFKYRGHRHGRLRNFSEVPLFLDSKASRLIQLADLVAYWIFRYFESSDDRGYKLIEPHLMTRHGRVSLITDISVETRERLAQIDPHRYPFPSPSTPQPPKALEDVIVRAAEPDASYRTRREMPSSISNFMQLPKLGGIDRFRPSRWEL